MKRFARGVSLFLCIGMLFTSALAAGPETYQESVKIVYEDGSYLIITTTIYSNSLYSSTSSRYAERNYSYTSSSGERIFAYTLKGWFTYNGVTSTATNASASITIHNANWSLKSHNEYCSGNTVYGTATFSGPTGSRTVSGSVTCDKNGNIK